MAEYVIEAATVNNMGRVRKNNEDNFYMDGALMEKKDMDRGGVFRQTKPLGEHIFAVCDGMGGMDAGEDASYGGVATLAQNRTILSAMNNDQQLTKFIRFLSDRIYNASAEKNGRSGSTLVMLMVQGNVARVINVGDSRIYRLRGNSFEQISKDQSEVQRMIDKGIITKAEARVHPKRNVITQYLGMPSNDPGVSPDISRPFNIEPGDKFLLCSDGLSDMVEDGIIGRALAGTSTAVDACAVLTNQALKNGGKDNVTVMTLIVREKEEEKQENTKKGFLSTLASNPLNSILLGVFGAGFLMMLLEFIIRLL